MASGNAPRVDIDPGQGEKQGALQRVGSTFVDRPWLIVVLAGFVILCLWIYGTRTQKYEIKAVFDEGVSLYSGLDVRVDGIDAGKVKKVENVDGQAVVTLGIDDEDVWPLTRGTEAILRFGTTIGNGTRIIELDPGDPKAPEIPDGGVIPTKDTVEPTEFDQLFDTLDDETRENLQDTLATTGETFGDRDDEISEAVEESADGLTAVGGFAEDLARDDRALRAFVLNTNRAMRTLGARSGEISSLIGAASETFDEFAQNTRGIEQSLDKFGPAVQEARTTLTRLDESVGTLDGLMQDLRPGAKELSSLSKDLRPALASLRQTVPDAVTTFRETRKAAPAITTVLKDAQPFSKEAGPALTEVAPMLACLRPYAPEIAGLLSTWSSFTRNYDHISHIGRIWANTGLTSPTSMPNSVMDSDTLAPLGQGYALVRPPGYNAGKPWFIPECGYTEDGLDATKDPTDE